MELDRGRGARDSVTTAGSARSRRAAERVADVEQQPQPVGAHGAGRRPSRARPRRSGRAGAERRRRGEALTKRRRRRAHSRERARAPRRPRARPPPRRARRARRGLARPCRASRSARVTAVCDRLETLAVEPARAPRRAARSRPGRRAERAPRGRTRPARRAALEPLLDEVAPTVRQVVELRARARAAPQPSRHRPIAARRRPYGSREPVGRWPSANATSSVSILSAADEDPARLGRGQRRVGAVGEVLLLDRGADGLRVACEPRVLGADRPSRSANSRTSSDAWSAFASRAASRASSPPPSASTSSHEPLRLVRERARALEEGDRAEPAGELLDADRNVAVERERRVVEPALEHAHVAAA